jgi:hypothetical protein
MSPSDKDCLASTDMTRLLICPPSNLAWPEQAAWHWAVIWFSAALEDPVFLRDHPDLVHSAELQRRQLLWLLEERAQKLAEGDDGLRGFARAAIRLAGKIRQAASA